MNIKLHIFIIILFIIITPKAYALEYVLNTESADPSIIRNAESKANDVFEKLNNEVNIPTHCHADFKKIIAIEVLDKYRWLQGFYFDNDTVDCVHFVKFMFDENKQNLNTNPHVSHLKPYLNSLIVQLWISRAKSVYHSSNAKYWNIPYLNHSSTQFEYRF